MCTTQYDTYITNKYKRQGNARPLNMVESRLGNRPGASRYTKRKQHSSGSDGYSDHSEALLKLENPSRLTDENELEDVKVLNYLKKLTFKGNYGPEKSLHGKLVISDSEAGYFELIEESFVTKLKDNFDINDFTISPSGSGTVERYISIVGPVESVSKSMVFTIFVLNVKLNNFLHNIFTLRSTEYSATLLVQLGQNPFQGFHLSELKIADTSYPTAYNGNPGVYTVYIQGDFNSLFQFITYSAGKVKESSFIEDSSISQQRLFGNHTDPALVQRSEPQELVLSKNKKKVLDYVYS